MCPDCGGDRDDHALVLLQLDQLLARCQQLRRTRPARSG